MQTRSLPGPKCVWPTKKIDVGQINDRRSESAEGSKRQADCASSDRLFGEIFSARIGPRWFQFDVWIFLSTEEKMLEGWSQMAISSGYRYWFCKEQTAPINIALINLGRQFRTKAGRVSCILSEDELFRKEGCYDDICMWQETDERV